MPKPKVLESADNKPTTMKNAELKKYAQNLATSLVVQGEKKFLESMNELDPKDYCDCYLKLLSLAVPRDKSEPTVAVGGGMTNLINTLSINLIQ